MASMQYTSDIEIKSELKNLFKNEAYNELGNIKISKESKIYQIMKECPEVIKGDFFINVDMLSEAYTRASIEFNYEMRDRLFKYINKYADNVRKDKSNENLIQKIICDDKVMNYIHKYTSLDEFINDPGRKKNEKAKKKNEKKKCRSYVMI